MSIDVAVWKGPRPSSDAEAEAEFARRCDALAAVFEAGGAATRATPALREFIDDVRRYFPDGERDDDGVWADGRLADAVHGDFLHTAVTGEGAASALDVIAGLAVQHGLVCYDPGRGCVLDRPVPGPPRRRPGRPTGATLRRLLAAHLEPAGFLPVDGGVRLDLDDGVRIRLTPGTVTTRGIRSADVSLAVYREADWQRWLREGAEDVGTPYDPDGKFYGGGEVTDFGLLINPGELLERPHDHGWLLPDRTAATGAAQHIAQLVVDRVLPSLEALSALLPNRRLGLRHRPVLGVEQRRWLGDDEPCPWAPCGERFRTTAAGGLWPSG